MRKLLITAHLLFAIASISGTVSLAAEAASTSSGSMLYLSDGDYFCGQMADSATENTIRWQTPDAVQPFEFNSDAIRGAYFAPSGEHSTPDGDYCFELTDGDILYASIVAITADKFQLDSPEFGRLAINREEVRRFTAMKASAFEYRGPNGLNEWESDDKSQWRDEAGRLAASTRGASIRQRIAIPQQAHFEFEISWGKSPQFTLAFCSSDRKEQLEEGFRLEVWGEKLVLLRELKKDADVAVVCKLDRTTDRVHLDASYDYQTGAFIVQSLEGKKLAQITMPKKGGNPLRYVWLINGGDQLCLEQLSVSHWNGKLPTQSDSAKPRIQRADGTIIYGEVIGLSAEDHKFVVEAEGQELRLDTADVAFVALVPEEKSVSSAIRIGLTDGTRLSGTLAKVEGGNLTLQRRGIEQPIVCAVSKLRSVVGLSKEPQSLPTTEQRMGLWAAEEVLSHGSLTSATATSDEKATCLVWKPKYSTSESALRPGSSGRIIYRELPQPAQSNDPNRVSRGRRVAQPQQVGIVGGFLRSFTGNYATSAPAGGNGTGTLCLVNGDRIPCRDIRIDDDGVHFVSSVVKSQLAPHAAVKALELVPNCADFAMAEEKRNRLLTLPRMQKSNPPTHLIVSTSGDFLRARLASMDSDSLTLEVRLDEKRISRDRVACIIWLPNEKESSNVPAPEAGPSVMRVQAVLGNDVRFTFSPREFNGTSLVGESSVLGECAVNVNNVDQLIFGSAIKKATEEQIYNVWKLSDAVEPQFAHESDGGEAGQALKSESALVAKPAPNFQLDILAGGHFQLSEHKGSVIVLDFWASWCGPCMQSMPVTDRVVAEFKDSKVQLVAVNMQEDKSAINGALERLKIQPTVAIDVDGAAAERYQVSAIPQVVVIDAESNVAEVLIGASPGYEDQLRDTIKKLLVPKESQSKP